MIDRSHALPLVAQARQPGIGRGSIYYLPQAVSSADLTIVRRIDELHLLYPFARSPAAGCCGTCSGRRARWSAGCMSRR